MCYWIRIPVSCSTYLRTLQIRLFIFESRKGSFGARLVCPGTELLQAPGCQKPRILLDTYQVIFWNTFTCSYLFAVGESKPGQSTNRFASSEAGTCLKFAIHNGCLIIGQTAIGKFQFSNRWQQTGTLISFPCITSKRIKDIAQWSERFAAQPIHSSINAKIRGNWVTASLNGVPNHRYRQTCSRPMIQQLVESWIQHVRWDQDQHVWRGQSASPRQTGAKTNIVWIKSWLQLWENYD